MQRYTYISENPFIGMKFHTVVDYVSEYGEVFIEERNGTWNTPYLFNGKELDEETSLYYYGARYLNPTNGMWLSTDPLFEKYVGMSPYNYCAGNPVKLVDPDGREIEEGSKEEWNENRGLINKKIESLQKRIEKYENKANRKNWTQEKLNGKTRELKSRLSFLNKKNEQLDEIEQSSQVYRLRNIEGELDPRGDVSLNPSDNVIEITYFSVANFVHETTHAWQFESGDIAFNPNRSISDGNTLFIDLFDEIFAYIMENAYSGYKTLSSINPDYVRNMTYNGEKIYGRLPYVSVNTHSSILSYDLAYRTHYWGGLYDKRSVKECFSGVYAK